jgi:transposase
MAARILRIPGYGVYQEHFDERTSTLTLWVRQVGADPSHTCGNCGVERREVLRWKERTVRDLPWGTWKVLLIVEVHRLLCRVCGVTTEKLPFLDGKRPYTRRFAKAVARDCEDAPARRVASKWGLSVQTVLRLDKRALQKWSRGRHRTPLRYMGIDEIFWKAGRCLTVVTDLESGEPIWAGPDRKRETIDRFFRERLHGNRRRSVKAVCVDMWQPFTDSVKQNMPHAVIVFDKFHIMQHVSRAVDETRRQEFFRKSATHRNLIRGKRWLLLRREEKLTPEDRVCLKTVLALNRPLCKAHILHEHGLPPPAFACPCLFGFSCFRFRSVRSIQLNNGQGRVTAGRNRANSFWNELAR